MHHHLICTRCNAVIEVEDDLLEELEDRIGKEYEFKIVDHSLQFFGICKQCQKNNNDE